MIISNLDYIIPGSKKFEKMWKWHAMMMRMRRSLELGYEADDEEEMESEEEKEAEEEEVEEEEVEVEELEEEAYDDDMLIDDDDNSADAEPPCKKVKM
jgi:hypothetical protein